MAVIESLFPRAGNRSKWEKRELVDAVLYFVGDGCKWRNLPHDFPPYTTVTNFYYVAIRSRLWEKIRAALIERVWTDAGRKAGPSCAIIDLQSVKTTSSAEERGIGRKKKTNGRERHIVKDYEISICSAQAVSMIAVFVICSKGFSLLVQLLSPPPDCKTRTAGFFRTPGVF